MADVKTCPACGHEHGADGKCSSPNCDCKAA